MLSFYIPQFAVALYVWVKISIATMTIVAYPLPPDDINNLLYALLGLGTLRTVEKTQGVNPKNAINRPSNRKKI